MAFLAKAKLIEIEVLISKVLTVWNISYHKFISTNNVLNEFDEIKEKIKNPNKKWICY